MAAQGIAVECTRKNQKLARSILELFDMFDRISDEDRQWAIANPVEAIYTFACAVEDRASRSASPQLLRFVTSTHVAAIEFFDSAESFRVGKKGAVQIQHLGENFRAIFGQRSENACEEAVIKFYQLLTSSADVSIVAELADTCEITLGQYFALLSKQGRGEGGPLLTNGDANIAYIRDREGILWAVGGYWEHRRGWRIVAYSIGGSCQWNNGRQVLSR